MSNNCRNSTCKSNMANMKIEALRDNKSVSSINDPSIDRQEMSRNRENFLKIGITIIITRRSEIVNRVVSTSVDHLQYTAVSFQIYWLDGIEFDIAH